MQVKIAAIFGGLAGDICSGSDYLFGSIFDSFG